MKEVHSEEHDSEVTQVIQPSAADHPSPQGQEVKKKFSKKVYELFLYFYGAVAFLLISRFTFSLFGARQIAPFVEFVYSLSNPLMMPFSNMFGLVQSGPYRIEFEVLVALAVYALVFYGIGRLVQIILD